MLYPSYEPQASARPRLHRPLMRPHRRAPAMSRDFCRSSALAGSMPGGENAEWSAATQAFHRQMHAA